MFTTRPRDSKDPHRYPSYHPRDYPVGAEEFVNTFPPERRQAVRTAIRHLHFKGKAERKWVDDQVAEMTDLPPILYKYVPIGHLDLGLPTTLRATQPPVLNDIMEANISTSMEGKIDRDEWYERIFESMTAIFGSDAFTHQELKRRKNRYGDPRISTIVRDYLSRFVGVVSFSLDPLIPTMWAHYADNSGFVFGYDTQFLRNLGQDLRRILYLELAPSYKPTRDNVIRLEFVDEERRKQEEAASDRKTGTPLLGASVDFFELCKDWQELSKVLFVKSHNWRHEQEVRLLIELNKTSVPAKCDDIGYPLHLLQVPPEAVQEVYVSFTTPNDKIEQLNDTLNVGHGTWKLKYVDSHAYRMQVTSTLISNRKQAPADR